MVNFKGHEYRTLDAKGRLLLPPAFRDQIHSEVPEGYIVLLIYRKKVIGITPSHWAHMEDQLVNMKSPTDKLAHIKRVAMSTYKEVPVSSQGRVAIPQQMRTSGKLGDEIAVVGGGRQIEFLPREEFAALLDHDPGDASADMRDNGIDLGIE